MKQFIIVILCLPILTFGQKNVGIGTQNPNSRLHIHQFSSTLDPLSAMHMTSPVSGTTVNDGLRIEMNGLTGSIINGESGLLSLGSGNSPALNILPTGQLGLNTIQTLGSADFTIRSANDFFGGMFVDSPNSNNDGKPFYGYALDRDISFYHYYDAVDGRFKFQFDNFNGTTFSFKEDGSFLLNAAQPLNQFTDLTLLSKSSIGFGGMYIDSKDSNTGKPFYGYAIGGGQRAFHYYDEEFETWFLNVGGLGRVAVGGDGNVGVDFSDPEEKLVVNGRLRLTQKSGTTAENGTIVFTGSNFFGRINGLWYKMTNATNGLKPKDNEDVIAELKAENEMLRSKLEAFEKRLLIMEQQFVAIDKSESN